MHNVSEEWRSPTMQQPRSKREWKKHTCVLLVDCVGYLHIDSSDICLSDSLMIISGTRINNNFIKKNREGDKNPLFNPIMFNQSTLSKILITKQQQLDYETKEQNDF